MLKLGNKTKWIIPLLIVGATALSVLISVEKSPAVFESPGISPLLGAGYQCDINSPKEVSVKNLVLSSLPSERPYKKGCEMAKIGSVAKHKRADQYFDGYIQIVEMVPINGGVEVFARAWDSTGKQYGFGKDGSVDLERFRIINPPIMVPDGTKTSFTNEFGQSHLRNNFKEDVQEAMLQSLGHTILVKQQKFFNSNIITGKRGDTTTTAYPDAGSPGTTSVDGYVGHNSGANISWTTLVNAAGNVVDAVSTNSLCAFTQASADSGLYNQIRRCITLFDTSSIPDNEAADSGTYSGYVEAKDDVTDMNTTVVAFKTTTAANTTLAAGDYSSSKLGALVSDTATDITSLTTGAYNDWPLNAAGKTNVSVTGITKMGWTTAQDQADSAPTWQANSTTDATISMADTAGTTQDPKLVVESSVPVAAPVISKPLIFFTQ